MTHSILSVLQDDTFDCPPDERAVRQAERTELLRKVESILRTEPAAPPPSKPLTRTWQFLCRFQREHGYSASVAEIAEHSGLAKSNAIYHLQRLEELGYIARTPNTSRSIRILRSAE